jgi:hypothetical protein
MDSSISPARRAATLSTLQIVGDAQHLVGRLNAFRRAYKKHTMDHAEILRSDRYRAVIAALHASECRGG